MDRQLAERMVGAACLLAVLVLVVPAILDGNPDSGATITHPAVEEELDLRTHTIRLDGAEREPPVPTPRQVQVTSGSVPCAAPETARPVAHARARLTASQPPIKPRRLRSRDPWPPMRRTPVPLPPAKAPATGGDWIVQLGSFSQRDNADRLAADLQSKGFSVSVQGGGGASGTLFRVRAGPERTGRVPRHWPPGWQRPGSRAAGLAAIGAVRRTCRVRLLRLNTVRLHPAGHAAGVGLVGRPARTDPRSAVAGDLGGGALVRGPLRRRRQPGCSQGARDPLWQLWAGRLALFVGVLFAGSVVAWLVSYFVRRSVITGTDRILGMLFGLARGVVLAGILVLALELGGFAAEPWWRESKLLPYAAAVGAELRDVAQEQLAQQPGVRL